MKKPIIYLSGPYRAEHESDIFANIMIARHYAIQVWEAGGIAICPHLNTMLMGSEKLTPEIFIEGDLQIVERCDALFRYNPVSHSAGADKEETRAIKLAIPVFHHFNALVRWINKVHGLGHDKVRSDDPGQLELPL